MDGASENGNVEITQMLIQHGYPVNETTAWYAMKNAARTGQTAIIQYWVSLGYDPDYRSAGRLLGRTDRNRAISTGHRLRCQRTTEMFTDGC